jgi:hypothetical protein
VDLCWKEEERADKEFQRATFRRFIPRFKIYTATSDKIKHCALKMQNNVPIYSSAQCLILSEVAVYILNRGIKRLNENIHINPATAGHKTLQ